MVSELGVTLKMSTVCFLRFLQQSLWLSVRYTNDVFFWRVQILYLAAQAFLTYRPIEVVHLSCHAENHYAVEYRGTHRFLYYTRICTLCVAQSSSCLGCTVYPVKHAHIPTIWLAFAQSSCAQEGCLTRLASSQERCIQQDRQKGKKLSGTA